ncbi:MAG TPA: DUF4383 domain-containing protein [Thermoleophilaceae bacterium]
MQQRSPAQKCAVFLGVLLLAAGIAGFFYNGTFTSNEHVHDDLLGLFAVNGWSNTMYIVLGIWGLASAGTWVGGRTFGYAAGLFLCGIAVWGFILGSGESILSIVPASTANSVAWLVLGIIAVVSAVSTSPEPAPTTLAASS